MPLTYDELTAITNDYFAADNGKAVDIFFDSSFFWNWLFKQKKGLYMEPPGGLQIRVPLLYDGQTAGFYTKGDTLSSDDREALQTALFDWKHAYSNASVYRLDTLVNRDTYAEVQLVESRLYGATESLTKLLSESVYAASGAGSNQLTGLLALCNETTSQAYGGIAEADLVSQDGTKPWEGKLNSTSESLSLAVLRTLRSDCKLRDGAKGKPDLILMTETLFNVILDILQVQQRFTKAEDVAKAGFTGLEFEGAMVTVDDFCPSGHVFAINSNHIGFAVHPEGRFNKQPWMQIPDSAGDKTMKIFFDGNIICNDRRAHKGHSNLS